MLGEDVTYAGKMILSDEVSVLPDVSGSFEIQSIKNVTPRDVQYP